MPQMTTPNVFAPPSAPMLAMPVTSQAERVKDHLAQEGRPEPDDIPEPEVPVEAATVPQELMAPPGMSAVWREHEALAKGFCEYLQKKFDTFVLDKFKHSERVLSDMCEAILRDVESALFKHTLYAPYTVTIQALSPNGYPFTMTITKATKDEVRSELVDTAIWLAANGCKVLA